MNYPVFEGNNTLKTRAQSSTLGIVFAVNKWLKADRYILYISEIKNNSTTKL